MARNTSDILKLTGAVGLPATGAVNYPDTKDNWDDDLNAFLLAVDNEFALVYAGDPNTHVAATYVGKKVFDTVNNQLWAATTIGNAATAVWQIVKASSAYRKITTAAGTVALTASDEIVEFALSTPAAINVTLPTGLSASAVKKITVIDGAMNASNYPITINSANLINGSGSVVLNNDGYVYNFLWNGTTWRII